MSLVAGKSPGPGRAAALGRGAGSRALPALVALALVLGGARGSGQATAVAAADPGALERVVVLGASLSSGFLLSVDLADALDATIVDAHRPIASYASNFFFVNPLDVGEAEVDQALLHDPTAVVAVDFLFWYGYGAIDAERGAIETEVERLELLEVGLERLEEIECPLVISDFPDMSAAVGRMLTKRQMPDAATLDALSRRVREWAGERPRVIVLPLAEIVRALAEDRALTFGRQAWPEGSAQRLLQRDRLHPTLDGLCGIAQLVADELVRRGLAAEQAFDFDVERVIAGLREAAAATASAREKR